MFFEESDLWFDGLLCIFDENCVFLEDFFVVYLLGVCYWILDVGYLVWIDLFVLGWGDNLV